MIRRVFRTTSSPPAWPFLSTPPLPPLVNLLRLHGAFHFSSFCHRISFPSSTIMPHRRCPAQLLCVGRCSAQVATFIHKCTLSPLLPLLIIHLNDMPDDNAALVIKPMPLFHSNFNTIVAAIQTQHLRRINIWLLYPRPLATELSRLAQKLENIVVERF